MREQKFKKLTIPRSKQLVERNRFVIDYETPFFDVYKELLQFTIKSDGFLDIIHRPWGPGGGILETMRP